MGLFDWFVVRKLIRDLDVWGVDVRTEAIDSLIKIGKPAVKPLIQALKDEEKSDIIYIKALEKIGDTRAIDPLIQALEHKEVKVRKEAALALGTIGDAKAIAPLIQALEDEGVYEWRSVQDEAQVALQTMAETAIKPLIHALKDENSKIRQNVATALGSIEDKRAVEPLIYVLEDEEGEVRKRAAEALGWIGDKRAVEPLIYVLEDEEGEVRKRAAWALGWIRDKRAVEPLIQALKDGDEDVKRETAEALGRMGDKRAVEPLIYALEDEEGDIRVRDWAAGALGRIGDKRAVEPLIYALEDENGDIRIGAAGALGEIGDERAVAPLIQALKDKDERLRKYAAEALGYAKTFGILYNIDDLGGGFYGNKAWRVFMKNCDPKKLSYSVLLEGDTSGTLAGHERIFCIAVQTSDSSVIIYLKESFKSCEEKGLLPPDKRFIEGNVADANHLVVRGRIDSFGKFVTNEWTRIDEDLCEECGWEYAPVK